MTPLAQTSIAERFEQIAYVRLEQDAVRSPESSLTYGAMRDLSDRVAHALIELGGAPGCRALLLFGHRPEGIAAIVGSARGGAVAVPLTVSTPAERRERIFTDAEPVCVISDRANHLDAQALANGRVPVLTIEDLPSAPRRDWPRVGVDDPAFILYTSGSTGDPKGVVLTHRSVLNQVDATATALGTHAADRVVMISTFAVGQGFATMFSTLLYGATLCLFDVRQRGFDALIRFLVDERISIYISSASLFRSLVRTLGEIRCPDIRFVRLSSERVTPDDVFAFRRLFSGHARLAIAYSSTETSTISIHIVDSAETFPDGVVPVGRPVSGVRVTIVDEAGRAVDLGQEGEITAEGGALPLGYWRDPVRTATVYQESRDTPGERFCRTGDLGRLRKDGVLEHLGRKDRRVKIRGFRVELEEVEGVLARHPSVSRAAVVAQRDQRGDNTLVGYVELARHATASIEEIRRFATSVLADAIVPTAFVEVDAMPMTDAGKVNYSALPSPHGRPALGAAFEPPDTNIERIVAHAWKEVLALESVGVHDPFLMVGGDSLRAAQVAARVSDATGVEVLLVDLLEMSTIRKLAHLVVERAAKSAG